MGFGSEGPTLFRQIAGWLGVILALFVLIDTGLVFWDYACDEDGLAQDMLDQQADRILAAPAGDIGRLALPWGVERWEVAVSRLAPGGDSGLISWTQRAQTPQGVRISGVRYRGDGVAKRWVRLSFVVEKPIAYLPAIWKEMIDHVISPLIPLIVIMSTFATTVVRRLLQPLRRAVREADGLSATPAGRRLTVPAAPREVRALVQGFNGALDRIDAGIRKLDDFTAQVAHELRTPLAILRLAVDEVQPPALRRQLQNDLVAMTRLVNQMLDLAKAESLAPPAETRVDLGALARDVVARRTPLVHQQQGEIRFYDQGGDQVIAGDSAALARALSNLIDNAMKHGGTPGLIDVTVGPGTTVSVRDHGPGIEDADLERVFERFWRKYGDDQGGAGLGLEIVRTIVAHHGGNVAVANAAEGGAVFTMRFAA
jgi:signal transduction histidine kinase